MERAAAARVLGVDVTASPAQVRDAFRGRARKIHPDTGGGDAAAMVELIAAYQTLMMRVGTNWQFAEATPDEPWTPDADPSIDDDHAPPNGSLLRWFGVALAVVGLVMTTVVFVAAIGYDWSLSP